MAMQEKIPTGFSQVLAGIVNITFRYNVISNLQAAEQERTYSRVAIGISDGTYTTAAQVLAELRSIYPNDEIFKANFASKTFDTTNNRNKQIVRYILAKVDAQSSGTPFSWPASEITLEHILPENPAGNWPQFTDVEASAEVFRLGNMMLLEENLNRNAANLPFEDKKAIFANSNMVTAQDLSRETEDWSKAKINSRQQSLARIATSIWRIAQLH
jgi:hypothetical protein